MMGVSTFVFWRPLLVWDLLDERESVDSFLITRWTFMGNSLLSIASWRFMDLMLNSCFE